VSALELFVGSALLKCSINFSFRLLPVADTGKRAQTVRWRIGYLGRNWPYRWRSLCAKLTCGPMKALIAAIGLCLVFVGSPAQQSPQDNSRVTIRSPSAVIVRPRRSAPVALAFHIKAGYHVNSNRPVSAELKPTQLQFRLPDGLLMVGVQYPTSQLVSLPFDPTKKLSLYSGDFVIKAKVVARSDAALGPYTIHGDLTYQVCDSNAFYPVQRLPFDIKVTIGKATRRH
jgi:hypothetical protein